MGKLILLRHGTSVWNEKNLFTGWVDVSLSGKGIEEALFFGKKISKVPIDVVFVSALIRAQMTAMVALSVQENGKTPCIMHAKGEKNKFGIHDPAVIENCLPVYVESSINERMYGKLQGVNKGFAIKQYGNDLVQQWRRGFDSCPPGGETLKMTAKRVAGCLKKKIVPFLQNKKNVLVVAHANSLRAMVMGIEDLSKEEIINTEIVPCGHRVYIFNDNKWEKSDDLS